MSPCVSLDDLGQRICIVGPSNSGKSTLAKAIGLKKSLPIIHLDQLHHQPNSQWIPRAPEEFLQLHDTAIARSSWVIEGNYGKCLHSRLQRATGLILLDISVATALLRYIARCNSAKPRVGGIGVQKEKVSREMLKHILFDSPKNHLRYLSLFEQATIPKLLLSSPRDLNNYYHKWQLNK